MQTQIRRLIYRAAQPAAAGETRLHSRQSGSRRHASRARSKRPTGCRCASPAGCRRPAAKARCASSRAAAECIEKYFETVRDLRARGFAVATSIGAARAFPTGRCRIRRKRPRRAASPNTTSISRRSCARSCCRIARRRSLRIGHSMGATVAAARRAITATAGSTASCSGADDRLRGHASLPRPARSLQAHAARSASVRIYVPGRRCRRIDAAAVRRQYRSPPIRCATPATPPWSKPSRRSVSAGRRSPGRTRPSARWQTLRTELSGADPPADPHRRRRP